MDLTAVSSAFLFVAFLLYCLAFIGFAVAITGRRWSNRSPETHSRRWGWYSYGLAAVGFVSHAVFFGTRWAAAGHIPTSNMFEFMAFLAMMTAGAFLLLYAFYRAPVFGAFAMPVCVVLLAYASVFPKEIQPLIPALQSYWLYLHVTTAAAGEAFFAVGFAAALMYLVRTVDFRRAWPRRGVEFTLYLGLVIAAFAILVYTFRAAGYEAVFREGQPAADKQSTGSAVRTVTYTLPPIVAPADGELLSMDPFLGLSRPLFRAPSWMNGVQAGRKLNTVIWSVAGGAVLYGLLRTVARKPLGQAVAPLISGLDPEDLDEVSYRAIAIGYPIFSLGALVFAMIWAQEAWGRFWGWDPKETWAFITWLFYTAYLHLRLSWGWRGMRSAWLCVLGFLVVMFTLVGVNLVIAGLHSYAGV